MTCSSKYSFRRTCRLDGSGKAQLTLGFAAALALASPDAEACGGLFCSASNPVNQAAERIIFADNGDGTVTAAIEIQYEGPSEEFAWVLPVPAGDVEVGVASTISFDRIQQASNPQYNLQVSFEPGCDQLVGGNQATTAPTAGGVAFDTAAESADMGAAVTVISEGSVGPYDYVQLEVDDSVDDPAQVAIDWLEENNYDVTDIGPDVLRGYLAEGMNLLAFRLTKDQESGAIRPLLLTYQSDDPMIPIVPTAVAANEDMGVMVWVLGSGRAIPKNYLHLELNEAMINWFSASPTYNDVIVAAADEAGGHGFVTEQSGAAGQFSESAYATWEEQQWNSLRTGNWATVRDFIQNAIATFGTYDGFADVLADEEVFPLREGATVEQFIACVDCYFQENVAVMNQAYPGTPYDPETDPINDMDVLAFLDKMEELVITPLSALRDMFDSNESVTRLYTTLSPHEMTVDPVFDLNPELEGINNIHTADQIMLCGGDTEWRVELPQGMTVVGNGRTWPIDLNSDFPVNFRVVQLETSGKGEVLVNNVATIGGLLESQGVGEPGSAMQAAMDDSNDSSSSDDDSNDSSSSDDDSDPSSTSTGSDDDNSTDDAASSGRQASSGGCSLATNDGANASGLWLGLLGVLMALRRRRGGLA